MQFIVFVWSRCDRNDHTTVTAPLPLLSEVKHCRARLVLRWGTTLESLVLFFCSFFCHSFWPPPRLQSEIRYIIIALTTRLCPFFCSAFALSGLVAWPNFASLEMREVVIKIRSWLRLRCIVCLIVRLSSIIQTCMKDVESSTC